MLFPGLSFLVIEDVIATDSVLQLTARSAMSLAPFLGVEPSHIGCTPGTCAGWRTFRSLDARS
ncbi:hypothetical protein FRP1_29425 (plasmid) [Pseudonocardia sp. EC080625-04]|nr:hypothetical protein FRP1_29425 [Pseudonocardia sp. EC080625-04]